MLDSDSVNINELLNLIQTSASEALAVTQQNPDTEHRLLTAAQLFPSVATC